MKYRTFSGFQCVPEKQEIEEIHLGVDYDYAFAGERHGDVVHLLLMTQVTDHQGKVYSRRSQYMVNRIKVVDCIEATLREHLVLLGVDPVQLRGLMRDFEFDKRKKVAFDVREFNR